jgi:hypothetical protein
MIAVNTGTATKRVANLRVNTGTATKRVQNAWLRTADGLQNLFGSLSATLDKTSVSGGTVNSITATAVTGPVTVTANGGTGEITYLWSQVSGDSGFHIGTPNARTTIFDADVDPGTTMHGVFKATLTDSTGETADSPTVTATVRNIGGGTF